jgi:hypothetical protein
MLKSHTQVNDMFKVQEKPMDFILIEYKKLTDKIPYHK